MEAHRRLPHQYPEGKALFVTWHLNGAVLPAQFAPPKKLTAGQAFVWMDRYLDSARAGPMYLRQPEIAKVVVDAMFKGVELKHYDLHAYVVMANHVHMLIDPKIEPSRLMQMLKGATAREANRVLGLTGTSFWQKESYDHWVRDAAEFDRIRRYIENNPVKAGIVHAPGEFPWSSAYVDTSVDAAR
jgi:REP element-mobilizing transposase RayT